MDGDGEEMKNKKKEVVWFLSFVGASLDQPPDTTTTHVKGGSSPGLAGVSWLGSVDLGVVVLKRSGGFSSQPSIPGHSGFMKKKKHGKKK